MSELFIAILSSVLLPTVFAVGMAVTLITMFILIGSFGGQP